MRLPEIGEIELHPRVTIEVSRWSFTKRRPDGSVDFVSPLPCPYNYGSVTGHAAPDGDPLDALVLGRRLPRGITVTSTLRAVFEFRDDGLLDPKLVCSPHPLTDEQRRGVERFFAVFAAFKRTLYRARGRTGETRDVGWMWPRA